MNEKRDNAGGSEQVARATPLEAGFGTRFAERELDWRHGALYYQVFVDRFAPAANLAAKRHLYAAPRRVRSWSEEPRSGEYLPEVGVWSHEIDFWGGDLQSLLTKLDYIEALGITAVYLNPIHSAYTNHKYDARDYFEVSPEYGTRDDLKALARALHTRGMRLVLDGVFNHMGLSAPWFQAARANSGGGERAWFYFGSKYQLGYRAWYNVPNLPELRLEHPDVQKRVFGSVDSVIQGYLRDGVDGWRLDVASDLGFDLLQRITDAVHSARSDAISVGEVWNYPEQWSPALDAVINFHARRLIFALVEGAASGAQVGRLLARMVEDADISALLMSWLVLDNHDTCRLKTKLPKQWQQRMAQILQFTLPGSPCIYYGVELGLNGGADPEQRGPFRWDQATKSNPYYDWFNELVAMHRSARALRVGDFRLLDSETVLAFQRSTERAAETCVVVANPHTTSVTDLVAVRDSKIMNRTVFRDVFSGAEVSTDSGTLLLSVPPHTIWVLRPQIAQQGDYTPYKRVP